MGPARKERSMAVEVSPLAGKPAPASMLVNVPRLVTAYFSGKPDPAVPSQRVAFGTSGHRGSAFNNAFNEAHILAISQALCDYRRRAGIDGQRCHRDDRRARRIYPDARDLACDPDLQQEPDQRSCRWRGDYPFT